MEYLVSIAEGPKTIAGELGIEARMALADAGFEEAGQREFMGGWPEASGYATGLDMPDEELEPSFRRLVYRFDADSESEVRDALSPIVGDAFNVRVRPREP